MHNFVVTPSETIHPDGVQTGWKEMRTGEVIPLEDWAPYCFAQCGIVKVDDSAPLYSELAEMVPDWIASGNWVRYYGSI